MMVIMMMMMAVLMMMMVIMMMMIQGEEGKFQRSHFTSRTDGSCAQS